MNRQNLRRDARAHRRALSAKQQRQHAEAISKHLRNSFLLHHQHYAGYCATDGEVSLHALFKTLLTRAKHLYLPTLKPRTPALYFKPYDLAAPTTHNRFGIIEPATHQRFPAWALDVVFVPLVAFDTVGHRVGMGGGFYDRTFEFMRQNQRHTPKLVGVAHECQKYPYLSQQAWDIPLSYVVTEQRLYQFSSGLGTL